MKSLIVALVLLVGCVERVEHEQLEPAPAEPTLHTFTVDIPPDLQPELVEGVLEAIALINSRLGFIALEAMSIDTGVSAPGHIQVDAGLADSNDIGWAEWWPDSCDVLLRYDATDWTIFAHEALHCFDIPHSDDAENIMYGDAGPNQTHITDEQVEQIRAHLTW